MKITITIPDSLYKKLESDRGRVPRSTYIQGLIGGSLLEPVVMVPKAVTYTSYGGDKVKKSEIVEPKVKKEKLVKEEWKDFSKASQTSWNHKK